MMLIGTVEWETVSLTADFIIKQSSVAPRFNARLEYTLVLWRSVRIPNPIKQTINPPIKYIFFSVWLTSILKWIFSLKTIVGKNKGLKSLKKNLTQLQGLNLNPKPYIHETTNNSLNKARNHHENLCERNLYNFYSAEKRASWQFWVVLHGRPISVRMHVEQM